MLDIGWTELLVIAVILIVVVGPKDLPPMIRAFLALALPDPVLSALRVQRAQAPAFNQPSRPRRARVMRRRNTSEPTQFECGQ